MMTNMKAGLLTAISMFILAGCAGVPLKKPAFVARGDYGPAREYISALIRQEMEKQQITGLSIALVDDQKVVWAEGFGYADKAKGIAATPDTIYRAGSISKLFTATAAMQLVDDGVLNIDRPLQRYLPEFSIKSRFPDAAPITPRSLLTHHSGLPSDLLKGMWTRSPVSVDEEVTLLRDEYAANPPGFVFAYSNVGMTLLGHALEKIVDRDFASYMSISLFMPLRMTNSSFSPKIDRSSLGSKAYRANEEADETPLRDIPAGGLNTSVLDLSRFISMVFGGGWSNQRQVLKTETVAEMLTPQNSQVPLDLSFRVGLGWMLGSMGGLDIKNAGSVAHHSGATLYHRSQLVILPEQKLGVVVLANSASAAGLINKVAAETLKLALEAKSGITQPSPQQPVQAVRKEDIKTPDSKEQQMLALEAKYGTAQLIRKQQPIKNDKEERKPLTQEELKAYEGHYDTIVGLVEVRKKSDYLEAAMFNRTVRLVPRPDGLLEMNYKFLGLFPVSLGKLDHIYIDREMVTGRNILKVVIDGNEFLAGEQLKPGPISDKWQQRSGEYEIINAGDDAVLVDKVRLRYEEGLLKAEYTLPLFTDQILSLALAPLSETEAVICGLGRGKGETVRVVTREGQELLAYSGYLLRKKAD
ncbi:MAG TPA: serine hydrolase domain-containing protein [Geobacteraceae bacterium]|nr:serine hydrolase domain-containing protein [Geobacteraceae bacterium]